jgi:hypothetical protein
MTENKSKDTIQSSWKDGLAARRLFIPGEDESVFHENYREFMKTLKPATALRAGSKRPDAAAQTHRVAGPKSPEKRNPYPQTTELKPKIGDFPPTPTAGQVSLCIVQRSDFHAQFCTMASFRN